MRIRLYFDEDAMDSDLVRALRVRGVEVITAYDVGLIALPDEKHLSWAAENGRVLYSFNVSDPPSEPPGEKLMSALQFTCSAYQNSTKLPTLCCCAF